MTRGERLAVAFILADVATMQLATGGDHSGLDGILRILSWLVQFVLAAILFLTAVTGSRSPAIVDRNATAPRRETGLARKGESNGAARQSPK
jgi:hypothetical protein